MDGSRYIGGYNPVSPRFYESVACFCRIIGRFPHNEEFKLSGLNEIIHVVESYEEFEAIALCYLWKPFDKRIEYLELLVRHVTTHRANLIRNVMSKMCCEASLP